jgi:hypothetical protein
MFKFLGATSPGRRAFSVPFKFVFKLPAAQIMTGRSRTPTGNRGMVPVTLQRTRSEHAGHIARRPTRRGKARETRTLPFMLLAAPTPGPGSCFDRLISSGTVTCPKRFSESREDSILTRPWSVALVFLSDAPLLPGSNRTPRGKKPRYQPKACACHDSSNVTCLARCDASAASATILERFGWIRRGESAIKAIFRLPHKSASTWSRFALGKRCWKKLQGWRISIGWCKQCSR